MIYQQLSGEQLPDIVKLSVVVNGFKGSVKDFVLLNLDGDSSFGDLDTLLAIYVSMHVQHESSLDGLWDRACRDKPEEACFKQELAQGGKSKPNKGKGEAYPHQPSAYKGKGKQAQLPTREQWCSICWKKGHRTQACWWSNQQRQQQHLQRQAWYSPNKQQHKTAEASKKRSQNQVYKTDKPVAYSLAYQLASSLEHKTPAASFEHQAQATIQSAFKTPTCIIAQMDSLEHKTSNIQLDYAYIKQSQDREPTTILTWVESLTGLAGSLITTKKGPTAQQLDAVVTLIKRPGFEQSILQCDGEPALVKLVAEIGGSRLACQQDNHQLTANGQKNGIAACLLSSELCCLTTVEDTSFILLVSC